MKVQLLNDLKGDWLRKSTKPLKSCKPFYQRECAGYVHRARSSHMHYDWDGKHTHTSVTFWCGAYGFLYLDGLRPRKHAPAQLVDAPSPGRIVCATCQARAHGSGQVGNGRLGDEFVKFTPRADFFPARKGRG